MENKSQLKSGIVLSYVNLIIGNIIPLFYTPLMLRMMGQSEYGLYGLASSVTGYLSLLSMGIGTAVVRYLVKFRTNNDKDGEERMLGLFSCVFYIIAALTLVVGVILSLNVETIFSQSLTADELSKMKILTVLLSVSTAMSFAFSVFGSVILAHECFIFQQLLATITTIVPAFINLIILFLGARSIGIVIASIILGAITYTANLIYCFKVLNIKPKYRKMPFHMLKEVVSFSIIMFVSQIANMLYGATDKVLIGWSIGTIGTAVYNVGLTFSNMLQSISLAISNVLVPKITALVDKNSSTKELTDILIRVGRIQFLLIGLFVGGFSAFGREFIQLYAGSEYSESYIIAVLLMLPACIPLIQNVALSTINAMNKHKFRAFVYVFIAILNVFTTYFLVKKYGAVGAAFTTFVCGIIGPIIIMNIYYYKVIKLDIPRFWKHIIKLTFAPVLLTVLTLYLSKNIDFTNPLLFIAGVISYTLLYSLIQYHFLNEYEKSLIFSALNKCKSIFARFKKNKV